MCFYILHWVLNSLIKNFICAIHKKTKKDTLISHRCSVSLTRLNWPFCPTLLEHEIKRSKTRFGTWRTAYTGWRKFNTFLSIYTDLKVKWFSKWYLKKNNSMIFKRYNLPLSETSASLGINNLYIKCSKSKRSRIGKYLVRLCRSQWLCTTKVNKCSANTEYVGGNKHCTQNIFFQTWIKFKEFQPRINRALYSEHIFLRNRQLRKLYHYKNN